ncbi:MAG: hypothetical protein ACLPYW_07625 [Acidimicrobiales bacterium]
MGSRSRWAPITVLEDITFDVPKGRITVSLGPSRTTTSPSREEEVCTKRNAASLGWCDP